MDGRENSGVHAVRPLLVDCIPPILYMCHCHPVLSRPSLYDSGAREADRQVVADLSELVLLHFFFFPPSKTRFHELVVVFI